MLFPGQTWHNIQPAFHNKKLTPLLFNHSSSTYCHSAKTKKIIAAAAYFYSTKDLVVMPRTN